MQSALERNETVTGYKVKKAKGEVDATAQRIERIVTDTSFMTQDPEIDEALTTIRVGRGIEPPIGEPPTGEEVVTAQRIVASFAEGKRKPQKAPIDRSMDAAGKARAANRMEEIFQAQEMKDVGYTDPRNMTPQQASDQQNLLQGSRLTGLTPGGGPIVQGTAPPFVGPPQSAMQPPTPPTPPAAPPAAPVAPPTGVAAPGSLDYRTLPPDQQRDACVREGMNNPNAFEMLKIIAKEEREALQDMNNPLLPPAVRARRAQDYIRIRKNGNEFLANIGQAALDKQLQANAQELAAKAVAPTISAEGRENVVGLQIAASRSMEEAKAATAKDLQANQLKFDREELSATTATDRLAVNQRRIASNNEIRGRETIATLELYEKGLAREQDANLAIDNEITRQYTAAISGMTAPTGGQEGWDFNADRHLQVVENVLSTHANIPPEKRLKLETAVSEARAAKATRDAAALAIKEGRPTATPTAAPPTPTAPVSAAPSPVASEWSKKIDVLDPPELVEQYRSALAMKKAGTTYTDGTSTDTPEVARAIAAALAKAVVFSKYSPEVQSMLADLALRVNDPALEQKLMDGIL